MIDGIIDKLNSDMKYVYNINNFLHRVLYWQGVLITD